MTPLTILLAEDNPVNQLVAKGMVTKLGHTVDVANNGLEVLEKLRIRTYDVILMDVHMPEMDGTEATEQIRAEWPQSTQPTIIALTADTKEQQRAAYLAGGMDDYVSKPIQLPELIAALDRVSQ